MRWINLQQQYVGTWQNGVQVLLCTFYLTTVPGPIDFFHFKVFVTNPRISLFWQHGRGTHFWNLSQGKGHFFLSSQYTGEFVQGQRHGQGKVSFASGATYEGEWKHDKNHTKVQFQHSELFKVFCHLQMTTSFSHRENSQAQMGVFLKETVCTIK